MQWFLVTLCLNVMYTAEFMTSCNVLMDTWGWRGAVGRGVKGEVPGGSLASAKP